jgi:hypothetical protein
MVRLYPAAWRERYGEEFQSLLEQQYGLRASVDVIRSAMSERLYPVAGGKMDGSFGGVLRTPGALIPIVMSVAALGVIGVAALSGALVQQKDEGAAAHLWQLLMAGQLPLLAFFAIKWLPRAPKQSLAVLALQVGAALAAMAPVFLLHL